MCGDSERNWGAVRASAPLPAPQGTRARVGETDQSPSSRAPLANVSSPGAAEPLNALRSDVSPFLALCVPRPAAPQALPGRRCVPLRPAEAQAWPHAQSRSLPRATSPRPQGSGRVAMTSRGPGRASRTLEMEEQELLRRQIRLLQGESGRAGVARHCLSPHLTAGSRPPPRRGWLSTRRLDGQVGSGGEAGRVRQRVGDVRGPPGRMGQPHCPGFALVIVRALPALRRVAGGRSFSNRREAAPTPTGGHVLGVPRLPAPDSGAEGSGAAWQSSFGARGVFPTPDAPF